jgi:hypothetical protein
LERVQALSFLPVADARSARPPGGFTPTAILGDATEDAASTILPRLPPTRSLPFLAQYLAQEIIGQDAASAQWRARDAAYRGAALAETFPPQLDLDV